MIMVFSLNRFFSLAVSALLICTLSMSIALPDRSLLAAELLVYQGTMVPDDGDARTSTKEFKITVLRDRADDGGVLHWTIRENGRGELSWIAQFGVSKWIDGNGFNLQSSRTSLANPLILFNSENHTSLIPLALFQIADGGKINMDTVWKQGALSYRVTEREQMNGKSFWRVLGFNSFGTKRTVWVSADGVINRLEEQVTVGQGERHALEYRLVKREALSDELYGKTVAAFAAFTSLRDQLELDLPSKEVVWNDAQLKLLRAQNDKLIDIAKTTTLADLALIAKKDVQSQNGRRGGVAALMTRALGQVVTAPGFELYRGSGFDDASLKGKVTILHFWDYKDSPLSPPYGQVGYLDFLSRKYADKGLQVVGVVVRPELEDPTQRTRVRASTRKFASFMNLSYPVVADVQGYISELGDPRRAGAKLPLFVVLDKSGKVVHYNVGFYEVDRQVGLKVLHDLVEEQLE
jgi:hypothetical protein